MSSKRVRLFRVRPFHLAQVPTKAESGVSAGGCARGLSGLGWGKVALRRYSRTRVTTKKLKERITLSLTRDIRADRWG